MRTELQIEAEQGRARATRVRLPRGEYPTPIFMPVGTQATVKAMTPERARGARRPHRPRPTPTTSTCGPGVEVVAGCGGLHRFMGWPHLLLTDSGGYQVFSLRSLMNIDDEGVTYRSHHRRLAASSSGPRASMAVQAALGADIAMAFDHCPPAVGAAARRSRRPCGAPASGRGAASSSRGPTHQARFGIVQGGLELDLRRRHLEELCALPFDGYALGGLSVGERPEQMHEVLEAVAHLLPADRPRYLMGVGRAEDLLVAIGCGIDMFDCVMPTRNARNGQLFTARGRLVISQRALSRRRRAARSDLLLRDLPHLQPRLPAPPLPGQGDPLLAAGHAA